MPQVIAMMNKEMLYYINPEQQTPEELKALLDSPDPHSKSGIRDRAMLHLAYACGLQNAPDPRTPAELADGFSWQRVPQNDIILPEGLF